jgi:prepilin-type N-terminal cleavage/methylation domain-containing protein
MKKQNGFTLIELLIVVFFLAAVAVGIVSLYVLGHFITKFW